MWAQFGAAAGKERIDFGVELVEPRDIALELLHPLLVRNPALLEFDLSQLVVDHGSPVQHRQATPEPGQRGVVLRFAD